MSFDFNLDEILAMAEEIERNGANFYRKAAEGVSGSPNRDLLIELAQMEDQHEATFANLRKGLSDNAKQETAFDPQGETAQYIKVLAGTRVFFEKEIDVTSIKEILKEAIAAEKDSIAFYLGMKDLVPERLGKEKIDVIIKEEMSHIKILGQKLIDIEKPKPGPSFG
jgi:rubrerythrin